MSNEEQISLPFDKSFMESVVLKKHNVQSKLVTMDEPVRIDDGQGFMAYILRVRLTWEPCVESLPASVIVKLFTPIKLIRDFMDTDGSGKLSNETLTTRGSFEKLHKNECDLYNLLTESHPHLPIPICYYSQLVTLDQPGMLILEDFGSRAACVHFFDGLTVEQAIACVEAFAGLHAFSVKHPQWEQIFASWDEEEINAFNSGGGDQVYEDMYKDYPWEMMKCSMADYQSLGKFDAKMKALTTECGKYCKQVLCHGDAHTHNMMFEQIDGKLTAKLLGVIDWQVVHPGNPSEDLARLLCTSMNADLRRSSETDILQAYYTKLQELLGERNPFTFDDVQAWYFRSLHAQALDSLVLNYVLTKKVAQGRFTRDQFSKAILRGVCAIQDTLKKADWSFLGPEYAKKEDASCELM